MSSSSVNYARKALFFFLVLLFFVSLIPREATAARNTVAKSNDGIQETPIVYRGLHPDHPVVRSRPRKPYLPPRHISRNPHSVKYPSIGYGSLDPRHPVVKSKPGKPYLPPPHIPRNP